MPMSPSRRADSAGTARPGGIDVWMRSLPAWHVYNAIVLAATTAWALTSRPVSTVGLAIAAGIVAALVGVYRAAWVRTRIWHVRPAIQVAYGTFLVTAFAVLLWVSSGFAFLQAAMYAQLFFSLPSAILAIAGGLSIGVILAAYELLEAGGSIVAAAPSMAIQFVQAAAFTMLSAWIGAIIVQSAERQELLAQLEATRAELAAAEREAGILEERARLSREIHDTLAQGFASVVTQLEAADAQLLPSPERARGHLRAAEEVARASLEEARGLVWALRPGTLQDGGLPAALQRAAAAAAPVPAPGESPTAVDVTVAGQPRQLPTDVEVTLLRSAQEALANALRHGRPSRVTVTLTYFDDAVSLDVIDDGGGFDPSSVLAPGPAGGHGLPGMRERAERLGGHLDVESAPGDGTAIALQLPLQATEGGTR
jgi:signal transduction histidine kinase